MTVTISSGSVETGTFNLMPGQWNECSTKINANGRVNITFTSDSFFIDEIAISEGTTSGIANITLDGKQVKEYYNLQGMKQTVPFAGLNIVKYTDGSAKKVFINK